MHDGPDNRTHIHVYRPDGQNSPGPPCHVIPRLPESRAGTYSSGFLGATALLPIPSTWQLERWEKGWAAGEGGGGGGVVGTARGLLRDMV